MKKLSLLVGAVALSAGLGSPALAQNTHQVVKGTAIGAGGGALVGAIVPGMSVGTGALLGAGTGAAVTVINHHKNRHYYHGRDGRRYYYRNGHRYYG